MVISAKNEEPDKQIAEWWGGASGDIFKDNVTHEVEAGVINEVRTAYNALSECKNNLDFFQFYYSLYLI